MLSTPRRPLGAIVLLGLLAALAGCGKAALTHTAGGLPPVKLQPVAPQGAVSVATKNTTRLGGGDAASDAAAVARAVYPGLTVASRPQAVVIVDSGNWGAALAAAALSSAPLRLPVLYSERGILPEVSLQALAAMHPTGAAALGGAQVIVIGTGAVAPSGYRARITSVPADDPGAAAAVEAVLAAARSAAPHQVLVVPADAPQALEMPAAGLAAESGAPILFASAKGVPSATSVVLSRLHRPAIYLLGFSSAARGTLAALQRLGTATAITGASVIGEGLNPVGNAVAVSRYTDGSFGWGVKEPGHGLVFANASRPLDAPAAALLSATGDYGPMLLLEDPAKVPATLATYLSNIQPAYGTAPQYQPVRGAYNHGWLIGDERAISAATQAEIDTMLEIVPGKASTEESSALTPE